MPRGDGTGPNGMGPMTGRGMGYCAGYTAPGYMSGGFGRGRGGGRGFRRMQNTPAPQMWAQNAYPAEAAYPAVDEKEALQNQAENLEKQLGVIRDRLNALEKSVKKNKKTDAK